MDRFSNELLEGSRDETVVDPVDMDVVERPSLSDLSELCVGFSICVVGGGAVNQASWTETNIGSHYETRFGDKPKNVEIMGPCECIITPMETHDPMEVCEYFGKDINIWHGELVVASAWMSNRGMCRRIFREAVKNREPVTEAHITDRVHMALPGTYRASVQTGSHPLHSISSFPNQINPITHSANQSNPLRTSTVTDILSRLDNKLTTLEMRVSDILDNTRAPNVRGVDYNTPSGSATLVNQSPTPGSPVASPQVIQNITPEVRTIYGGTPQISAFSGDENKKGGEVTYNQWRFHARQLTSAHPEHVAKGAIYRSLRGPAFDLAMSLGENATLSELFKELESQFGQASNPDVLMQNFFGIQQDPKEKVATFAMRLRSALDSLTRLHPDALAGREPQHWLRDRFYFGLREKLREGVRFSFEHEKADFQKLLWVAKMREAEKGGPASQTTVKTVVTSQTTEGKSDLVKIQEQVSNIASLIHNEKDPKEKQKNVRVKFDDNKSHKAQMSNGRPPVQCYRCRGWGHMIRECPTPLNLDWEGLDDKSTPRGKENPNNRSRHQSQ